MQSLIEDEIRIHHVRGTKFNAWRTDGPLEVYLRITQRYINRRIVKTIDLATINVIEDKQNQGVFRRFLSGMEALAEDLDRVIYIENVLNPRFAEFFRRRGYTEIDTDGVPCFWFGRIPRASE